MLPDGAADVMTRVRALLRDLAAKLAGDTVLFEEAVALTEFIDPTPFAITGNTLVFRMREAGPRDRRPPTGDGHTAEGGRRLRRLARQLC